MVKSIDNMKAVDFYRHYLGEHADPAREFILAVYEEGSEHFYLRAPIEYNSDRSITFSESVPERVTVQLTEAIRDVMIKDTEKTTRQMVQQTPDLVPSFGLAFSCAFRKNILGTQVAEELKILRSHLPPQTPVIGFFSYGEIAPMVKGQESFFHGATLVTLLVGQRNGQAALTAVDERTQSSTAVAHLSDPMATGARQPLENLELENKLLKRKLSRSEYYRGRLEEIKEFNSNMHRKIIQEVERARAFLRMRASQSGKISDIVTEMNHHLTMDVLETDRFMTLFYLAIDPYSEQLHWVRAGHDPAILYDPHRQAFEELGGAGIALGLSEDFRYEQNIRSGLVDGQIIALGTDGIWEASNRDGHMFGKERFRDVIQSRSTENAVEILNAVYDELDQFTQGLTSEDDITLVVAKVSKN